MAIEYRRTITDEEIAALAYYGTDAQTECDRLIATGLAHSVTSYAAISAKTVVEEAVALKTKIDKLEKADKDAVEAILAKVSVSEVPNSEPMEG